tara:strand:- start:45 stop:461 length:417 start_codon:yes stop_codon:yes gene_type:complete
MKYILSLLLLILLSIYSKGNNSKTKTIPIQLTQKDSITNPYKLSIKLNSIDSLAIIDTSPEEYLTHSFDYASCWTKSMWELMINCGMQSGGCGSSYTVLNYNITKNKIAISLKNLPKDTYLIDFHLNNKSTRLEVQIE